MAKIEFFGSLKHLVKCSSLKIIECTPDKLIINYLTTRRASIKDVIESLGIPHTEVGEIKNNGKKVDFKHILRDTSNISVYPHNIPLDPNNYLFDEPIKEYRFITDVNVGKLTKFLRMLGFDCAYNWMWDDDKIVDIANREKRIVLSRDIQLLKRKKIIWGKLISSTNTLDQLKEVIQFFGLKIDKNSNKAFSRCLVCNTKLINIPKKEIIHRLEPKTKKYFNKFSICPNCDKIYWAGSHVDKMKNILDIITK